MEDLHGPEWRQSIRVRPRPSGGLDGAPSVSEGGAATIPPEQEEPPEAAASRGGAEADGTTEFFDMASNPGTPWAPQIGPKAMETMSEMGAEGSETQSELAARVQTIAQVLVENGHTQAEGRSRDEGGIPQVPVGR